MRKHRKSKKNNKKRRNCTYKKIKGGVIGTIGRRLAHHAAHHTIRPFTTETKKFQTGIQRLEPYAEKYLQKASQEYSPVINQTLASFKKSQENFSKNIPKKIIKSSLGSILSPGQHYIGEFAGPNIEEIMSQSQEPIMEKLSGDLYKY